MSNFLSAVKAQVKPEFITFADLDKVEESDIKVTKNNVELKYEGNMYSIPIRRFNESNKSPETKLYIAGPQLDYLIPEDTTSEVAKRSWE